MVKIQNTRKNFCCNSCAKMESIHFPVYDIIIGVDGSGQTTSISLCENCMKELRCIIDKKL